MRIARLLFVVLALLIILPMQAFAAGNIAVVVHPGVAQEDISFTELRKILLGDQQFWSGGKLRVTLLVRAPTSNERTCLLTKVYQMSEAQFKQYWIAKVFRAEATAGPKIITSNGMAGELVRAIPGCIALVNSAEIPKGVKVLKIDGKKPGDSGYKLTF